MNGQNDLHLRRLRKSLQAISEFREKKVTALDPEFAMWKQSTTQSLSELFSKDHDLSVLNVETLPPLAEKMEATVNQTRPLVRLKQM
jgi:hypothetical protein